MTHMATVNSRSAHAIPNATSETVKRPPDRWWSQRSVAISELSAVIVAGLGFAAYFGLSGRASDLGAGAAFGLAVALGIGGLFPIHDQWELSRRLYRFWTLASTRERREQHFEELRALNGFFLGHELANASSSSREDLSGIEFVRSFCAGLSLNLSVNEWERLGQTPSSKDELRDIVDMVRSRVEQYAPPQWWCFFQLGSTLVWMIDDIEARRSLGRVKRQLEEIMADPALEVDQRYFSAVKSLLSVLPATLPSAGTDWSTIAAQVNKVLSSLPQAEPSLRIAPFAVPISDWFWFDDDGLPGAMRRIGDGSLAAYTGGRFELSDFPDRSDRTVCFEDGKWSCTIHEGANTEHPCPDIVLVSDMTNGGQPITEARLILVHS